MTDPRPLILVVEDEAPIRRLLVSTLAAHGYRTADAATLQAARMLATTDPPDVLLLDLGLPDGDGVDLVRELRQWATFPILVLSARGQERDKVHALDAGADDYVQKPFGVPELLARIRASLRHAARREPAPAQPQIWGRDDACGFTVDLARRVVTQHRRGAADAEVKLTPTEFRLLAELVRQAGKVRLHAELLRAVWGPAYEHDVAYLRVYVGQLRQKLEPEPSRPRWFLTEPGVGYRLTEPDGD
ncbi:MAG: response regulator [Planctomycetes bacterium]|nr:response regulator [Planctomycetota bacterium]